MRVALVSEHANPLAAVGGVDAGGQNVHVDALATALQAAGHDVVVHTRRDDPDSPTTVRAPGGYLVHRVPAGPPEPVAKDDLLPHMRPFARVLVEQWRADPPDVAHAHFWMSGVAATLAGARTGTPVVQTFHALGSVKRRHQGSADTSPPGRVLIESRLAREVAHVVATCSDEVFELTRLGGSARRTTVVPCGVDLTRFGPGGPVAPRSRRPRVLSVGRLVERKGVDRLVRALTGLPGAELLVAGGPGAADLDGDPEARRLRRVARECGVAERVHLLGQVDRDELPALMRSADVVACTPWYEPFGIVPLEAMACGVPVVASAVGGLVDTVRDGVPGALVPPDDHDALVATLATLLGDPERRRLMGFAGVRAARSRYSWERVAKETAAVYTRVTERAVRPAHALASG